MQMHASCVARKGAGVLLLGPSGAGKSDMAFRLLDRGFMLVADDRVHIADGLAAPAPELAGLLEVRGLGIVRLPHLPRARVCLAVQLARGAERLPSPARHDQLDVPMLSIDPAGVAAAARVELALDCALGRVRQVAGAFA